MKRLIRWIVFILLVFMTFFILLITPLGLTLGLKLANLILPGKLSTQHATGLLIGPINIKHIEYQDQSLKFNANNLHLQWHPLQLFRGNIVVSSFTIQKTNITLKASHSKTATTPKTSTPFHFNLPTNLIIKHLEFKNTTIKWQKKTFIDCQQLQTIIPNDQCQTIRKNLTDQIKLTSINLTTKLTTAQSKINFNLVSAEPEFITSLTLHGKPSEYSFNILGQTPTSKWKTTGNGNLHQLHLQLLTTRVLNGNITGKINLDWQKQFSWEAKLKATNLKPQLPHLPSNITFNFNTHGKSAEELLHLYAHLDLITPRAKFEINAKHQKFWQLQWQLNLHQLEHFFGQAHGSVTSNGTLSQNVTGINSQGSLQIHQLRLYNNAIDSFKTTWHIVQSGKQNSSLLLQSQNLTFNGQTVKSMEAKLNGNMQQHNLHFSWSLDHINGNFNTQGSANQQSIIENIKSFNINTLQQNWRLQQLSKINYNIENKTLILSPLCLTTNANAKICLQANWQSQDKWGFGLIGNRIPLSLLTNFLEKKIKTNSHFQFNIRAEGEKQKLQSLQAKITIPPGNINYSINRKNLSNHFQQSELQLLFQGRGLTAKLRLQLSSQDYFLATFNLPHYRGNGLPKMSEKQKTVIKAQLNNINFLNSFLPNIFITSGKLSGTINITGQLQQPKLTGDLQLTQLSLDIPQFGTKLTNANVKFSAHHQKITYQAKANLGKSPITLNGFTNLKPNFPTEINIKGEKLLVLNTPEYIVKASPDINVKLTEKKINVTGQVVFPYARIIPQHFTNTTTLPEDEVTFIGKPEQEKKQPLDINAKIKLVLGKDVKIAAKGLKADLTGGIVLHYQPQQPVIANGSIGFKNGTFDAAGQKVNIGTSSSINFTNSPLSNPNLNIQATKTIKTATAGYQQSSLNNIIVGISVTNNLQNPKVNLYSNHPSMSQSDILSYLLLGTPASNVSASNLTLLLKAASALKLGKGQGFTNSPISQIQQGLGFTEFGIESTTTTDAIGTTVGRETSLVIGRPITDKLFVRYKMGVSSITSSNVDLLQLRYMIRKNLILQLTSVLNADSADTTDPAALSSGIDLLYTIER